MSVNIGTEPPYRHAETTPLVGESPYLLRRVSWGGIFSGIIVAIALQLLFTALGAGVGLGTVNTQAGTTPDISSLGLGAGIWWVVSSMIALGFGGYVAGWLAGTPSRWNGLLHGAVVWGIATLVTFYLLTSVAGTIVGGGFSLLSNVASTAGSSVKSAAKPLVQASGITPEALKQEAQSYLRPANPNYAALSPQDAQQQVATALAAYAKGGPDAAAAKARVIDIMAARLQISPDEAAKRFDAAQAAFKKTLAQAAEAAKTAANASAAAASKTSYAVFGDLLLDLIAASIGGALGLARRVRVTRRVVV